MFPSETNTTTFKTSQNKIVYFKSEMPGENKEAY